MCIPKGDAFPFLALDVNFLETIFFLYNYIAKCEMALAPWGYCVLCATALRKASWPSSGLRHVLVYEVKKNLPKRWGIQLCLVNLRFVSFLVLLPHTVSLFLIKLKAICGKAGAPGHQILSLIKDIPRGPASHSLRFILKARTLNIKCMYQILCTR